MKKTLFIIPMLAPMVISTAGANQLPDEINYAPYQRAYEQSSEQLEILTESLDRAKAQLQSAYQSESDLYRTIEALEVDIARTNSQISNHIDEKDRLLIQAEDLDREMNRINRRLTKAENRRTETEREVKREQRKLKPLQDKLEVLKKELSAANKKVSSANKRLKNLKKAKDTAQKQLNAANTAVANLTKTLSTQETTLTNIENLIGTSQGEVTKLEGRLSNVKSQQATEQNKLNALNKEIQALRAQMKPGGPRNPENREIMQKIAAKAQEVRAQSQVVQQKNKQVKNVSTKLANEKKKLATLNNQKKTLPAAINRTKTQLAAAKTNQTNKQNAFNTANTNHSTQNATVNTLVAQANAKSAQVNSAKDDIVNASGPLNAALNKLDDINQRIREIGERYRLTSNDYNSTIERIDVIERNLPILRRDQRDFNRDLRAANTDLITIQDNIIVLNGDVARLTSDVSQATTDRDLKYQEYISRYDYYVDKLNEAKALGASQTDAALRIARTDSNNSVDRRSAELGKQIGSELANAQADYWSSVRAEIKGYNDGYDVGYASEDDQARGESEGAAAGKKEAQLYGQNVLKPQYFNKYFADALKSGVLKAQDTVSTLQAGTNKELPEAVSKELLDLLSLVEPVTNGEIAQSNDIDTDLNQRISTFRSNLGQIVEQKVAYANPETVYQKPGSIPYEKVDCTDVYKGLRVFRNACNSEYETVFRGKYLNEHYDNFAAQYENLYENTTEETRSDLIAGLYEQGYKEFYPVAKASGVSDGKDQIYKEAFAIAKDNAYNAELPNADTVAKTQANSEVRTWVNNNASLTLTGASITDSNLRGGSDAKIALNIKNISPKELKKPVKIIITDTENASISNRTVFVQAADANATTVFKGINFKVSSSARSGEKIKIRGKALLPGGKYQTAREEYFEATATTAVNPKLSYRGLDYDSTPKVKGFRSYYIHNFDVKISAAVEDIDAGYTITLNPVSGYENLIQMKSSSVNTGKLRYGDEKEYTMKYMFPKAARKKTVKLELKYIFQGKVMSSEIIELKPH